MKKIVIVGGGISGLTSGIFAQKYGFESIVLEKNSVAGGVCTGWDRQGSHIDGCIHWLTGTKKDTELYDLWCEVGALDGIDIINLDYYYMFEYDVKKICFYNDYNKLREELLSVSAEDSELIDEFISACKAVESIEMPTSKPMDMMSIIDMMKLGKKMMSGFGSMKKYSAVSCKEFAERFKSPILQKVFRSFMPDNYSISQVMFSYATIVSGNGGIPVGGSKAMAMRMADKYKSLGGQLRLNTSVDEIIIKDGKAVGVKLQNGDIIDADYVISACDANVTLQKLLRGKYVDKQLQPYYDDLENNPLQSNVLVAFAVDGDVSNLPISFIFDSEKYEIAGKTEDRVGMRVYSYDKSLVKNGKTTITSYISQNTQQFDYWKKLYENKEAYKAEKMRIAEEILKRILKHFPELEGRIKIIDVATPATYERYCGAYKGSWMSFMSTPKSKQSQGHNGKIDGIDNFQISGQWIYSPGGLPCAVATGKFAVQRICKAEKIKL